MGETQREPLRVLFVEDDEVDLELTVLALQKDGFDVEWTRVDDDAALCDALAAGDAEIVLSDFSMPRFSGIDALKRVREAAPNMPFVFVSGKIGEERAIESIRNGATDYVIKSNMRRLGVAVRRALAETRARRVAEQIEQAHAQLAAVLEATSDLVVTCAIDGTMKFLNAAGRRLLGLQESDSIAPTVFDLHTEWAAAHLRNEAWPGAESDGYWQGELALRSPGGQIPVAATVSAHRAGDGRLDHYSIVARDLREREWYEGQIAFLANHDALTGLPNRALLADRVTQAAAHIGQAGRPFALIVVNLDGFRLVADGYGPAAGDLVLSEAGNRLQGLADDGDTAARIGGDTFVLLTTGSAHVEGILRLVERIREQFGTPFDVGGRALHLTASIGTAVFPRDGTDFDNLLRNADTAMHRAKAKGGGGFQFYESEMTKAAVDRVALENDLRSAVSAGQIALHYQPIVDLGTVHTVGFEALMRWRHPQLGWVSPATFIPVAESTGQILELGEWALHTACRQLRNWGSAAGALRMAVNVSALQFRTQGFAESVQSSLAACGVHPERLVLELTESLLVEDVSEVTRILEGLQAVGVQVAIDDFGTGYSSLAYLSRFPIDCLKIDRSFVQRYDADYYDAEIVRAIISLGVALDMRVVAEGVETADQLAFLRAHGCQEAQGYYFQKPAPPDEAVGYAIRP